MTETIADPSPDELQPPSLRVQGRVGLPFTCEQVWDALNAPAVLQKCIPGCERFERADDNHFDMAVALELGPLAGRFLCRMERREVDPLGGYSLDFDAQGGALGFFNGKASFALLAQDSGCVLEHDLEVRGGGRLAQLSQVLAQETAEALTEDFMGRLQSELQRRHDLLSVPPPASVLGAAPAATAPAEAAGRLTLAEAAKAASAAEASEAPPFQASFADDLGNGGARRPSRIPPWAWLLLAVGLLWALIDQL